MSQDIQRSLGRLESRMDAAEETLGDIKTVLHRIEGYLSQVKGGWKVLTIAGGIGGALMAVAIKVIPVLSLAFR